MMSSLTHVGLFDSVDVGLFDSVDWEQAPRKMKARMSKNTMFLGVFSEINSDIVSLLFYRLLYTYNEGTAGFVPKRPELGEMAARKL
jgi:hypothetical protein